MHCMIEEEETPVDPNAPVQPINSLQNTANNNANNSTTNLLEKQNSNLLTSNLNTNNITNTIAVNNNNMNNAIVGQQSQSQNRTSNVPIVTQGAVMEESSMEVKQNDNSLQPHRRSFISSIRLVITFHLTYILCTQENFREKLNFSQLFVILFSIFTN